VKRISQFLLFFSCIGSWATVEGKQVELSFNGTVQEDLVLNTPIDDQVLETPWQDRMTEKPIYCQRLLVENKGDQILERCLPFVNQSSLYTLDKLNQEISKSDQPLLALYQVWSQRVYASSSVEKVEKNPLSLLNFEGCCHEDFYAQSFAKLCAMVGISTRPVGIYGKECYDFYLNENWKLIDPLSKQLYLSLDNHSLVSSEEMIDDPFLVLRTKHGSKTDQFDFKKAWETLAHFEIVTPYLGQVTSAVPSKESLHASKGFDLYPSEQLTYQYPDTNRENTFNQSIVHHLVNLKARQKNHEVNYASPFPIKSVYNSTSKSIFLKAQNHFLQPNETFILPDTDVFTLNLVVDRFSSGSLTIVSSCSCHIFPKLVRGVNHVHLGAESNPTSIELIYDINETVEAMPTPALKIANTNFVFDHCTPFFQVEANQASAVDSIWWQISPNHEFNLIPTNFEQVETFTNLVTIPPITDTFFNANENYFFRVKGCTNGMWGEWSEPFMFSVKKPQPISDIEFNKLADNQYKISWNGQSNVTDYLIFGSNSLDFVPSVYCDTQINAFLDGQIIECEPNQNLVAVTSMPCVIVDGSLAYYRIIARDQNQLSVPSTLIHVYDQGLPYTRTILQVLEKNDQHEIVKRTEFPKAYSWAEEAYTPIPSPSSNKPFLDHFYRSCSYIPTKTALAIRAYTPSPYVAESVWEIVKPHLLPENHPIKSKLDRIFSATRVTLTPETFKKAGFKRYKPGRWSRVMASSNPSLLGYFIKAFADTELTIRGEKEDWKKWMHRIEGAKGIRECIARHGYQSKFKVPNKWIYPLPPEPSPPRSNRYLRKNFILIAEDVRAYDHKTNEKKYKKEMTRSRLDAFYTILDEEGLFDSVYAFNVPFCKDGKMAFIDTEYHHKWPIPFHKINRYLSSDMEAHWERLIKNGGPKH
jgi:hypothetical protein